MLHRGTTSDGPDRKVDKVLLLAPSEGLGGGIERYLVGVESALHASGVPYERLNLRSAHAGPPSLHDKLAFGLKVRAALRADSRTTRVVAAHAGLLPVTHLCRRASNYSGTVVIYYGIEVWQSRRIPGAWLARGADVRAVAISSFTGGALRRVTAATVVNPALDQEWYEQLIAAGAAAPPKTLDGPVKLITVFRLDDWESKGLPEVIAAIASLDTAIELVVVGSGSASVALRALVERYPWVRIRTALDDRSLAAEYALADIAVLATRTKIGENASGEGFGLCLVEAQLAGTAVIAPAQGGSFDAFQPGITGLAPIDESASALAAVLRELLDEAVRKEMSEAAVRWTTAAFNPGQASKAFVDVLLSPI